MCFVRHKIRCLSIFEDDLDNSVRVQYYGAGHIYFQISTKKALKYLKNLAHKILIPYTDIAKKNSDSQLNDIQVVSCL